MAGKHNSSGSEHGKALDLDTPVAPDNAALPVPVEVRCQFPVTVELPTKVLKLLPVSGLRHIRWLFPSTLAEVGIVNVSKQRRGSYGSYGFKAETASRARKKFKISPLMVHSSARVRHLFVKENQCLFFTSVTVCRRSKT